MVEQKQKWIKMDEFKKAYKQARKKELSFTERVRDFFDIMVSVPALVGAAVALPKSAAANPALLSSVWKDADNNVYCTAATERELFVGGLMKAVFGGFAKRNMPVVDRVLEQCTDYSAKVAAESHKNPQASF